MPRPPHVLLILDGYGINPREEANAVRLARIPRLRAIGEEFPTTALTASGRAVGLPTGLMGNSEVGHLNLGAGRVVWQEITRIDRAIEDGSFFTNPAFVSVAASARARGGALHLMGLCSDGGVHTAERHYLALLQFARIQGFGPDRVFVHAYLDGRDTPNTSGVGWVQTLLDGMERIGAGRLATLCGRYYGMDRDQRWERVQVAYDALTLGTGVAAADPLAALRASYERGETDEFVKPIVATGADGSPLGRIADGDAVIFFNFRADRAREMTRAFLDDALDRFPRKARPRVNWATMTQYDEALQCPAAFQPTVQERLLADILAEAGLRQFRTAETEKYAHVTYFFNGGEEKAWPGEERLLIPSPKVATYDLQPEMSAPAVGRAVVEAVEGGRHDVVVVNFANPDMLGHTGILGAAVKALETVDACVGGIVDAALGRGGAVLITADHGNCEQMIDYDTGAPHTYHTSNPVPFHLVSRDHRGATLRAGGSLRDVAPTLLHLLDLPAPAAMEGRSLLVPADRRP
ncbi:MAG: 2,3-bisphosphoglycerate-independent phosphoglycerate mutase [Planctomycetes bacterium]|nr:2,3-bisphosphoglycerate-independent phosphoglycerate mutase [Planctomycetota bacterium]